MTVENLPEVRSNIPSFEKDEPPTAQPTLFVPLRKQGGSTIVTIPPSVLKSLDLEIGTELQMDVRDGALVMVPAKPARRKHYTLAQLLEGVTPKTVKALNDDTAWSREGDAVGRELS